MATHTVYARSLCAVNNANFTITPWPQTRRWFLTLYSIVQTQKEVGVQIRHSRHNMHSLTGVQWATWLPYGVKCVTHNRKPTINTPTSNVSLKPAMHSLGYISNYSVITQTVLCAVLLLRLMLLGSSTGGTKHLVSDWNSCYHRRTFWYTDTHSETATVSLHRHAHTNMQNTAPKYTFKENCGAFVHLWLTGWQFIFKVWQAGL